MTQRELTEAQRAWIAEALARSKEPTSRQLDLIKTQFRQGAYSTQAA